MVQLSMLVDPVDMSLESVLDALGEQALASGVGCTAQSAAARACRRKFSSDYGRTSLTGRDIDRVRAYHRAVLRRAAYGGGRRESAAYRERLRVLSAARDLVSGGVPSAELRPELVGTLGMDKAVVDRVLGEMAGVA